MMGWIRRTFTPEQRRILKFMIVGGSGVPVNLITVFIATSIMPAAMFAGLRSLVADWSGIDHLTAVGLRDIVAYVFGIIVSIFTNFLLNNYWTWGDRVRADADSRFISRVGMFYLVSSLAAVVQLSVSSFLSAQLRGNAFFLMQIYGDYRVYHVVAPVAGIISALFINYVVNNFWTFRKKA